MPAGAKRLAAASPSGPIRVADLVARYRETPAGSVEQRRGAKPASARGRRPGSQSRAASDTWISAADLIARHRELTESATADRTAGRRRAAGIEPTSQPVTPQPVTSQSMPSPSTSATPVPALRPAPSIRVAIRPVLTVAAVITAIALIEAPNLFSSSSATTHSVAGGTTQQDAATTTLPATTDSSAAADSTGTVVTAPGSVGVGEPPHTVQRVSRAVRHAFKLSASHVPVMKPGQTVPGTWILPNNGPMTSCFCERWGSFHEGIDLAGKLGSPILAVGDGTVLQAGPASGFGNWVVIQHANGDVSIYGHMQYFFVHKGQKVKAGEKIALVGDEGFSTGPHLHFEVHKGGLAGPKINPVPWLKARGITVGPLNKNG